MGNNQPWKAKGMKKAEWLAEEVAKAVGAGKSWKCETVDFSDPNRPPTCIEVDFPIIPINQIAAIEGNAGKPIYQMSKWWARRRSSVFRSMLLASAIKSPADPSEAAKLVWDAYYGNHQKKGAFKDLKVADIFMGGGTTVIEGSRLGMQMYGNDLNPVAWFVVKNELAQVDKAEVEALLADIEAEVKPQIMPFYACDCPRGHTGEWTQISNGKVMDNDFDPLALTTEERKDYRYHGPEIIYAFWAKHGPCQVTGCGHRTPIVTSPVMAIKTLTVKSWARTCKHCGCDYDLEEREARMAPGVTLVAADAERLFAVAKLDGYDGSPECAECPSCGKTETFGKLGKGKKKKIDLSLLVHPEWLQGEASQCEQGKPYGGSVDDPVEETIRWNQVRAEKCRLIEVRGKLPGEITCPDTGVLIRTGSEGGTSPKQAHFECGSCGVTQKLLDSLEAIESSAPQSIYALHCICPICADSGALYNGRFFQEAKSDDCVSAAEREWGFRKNTDLEPFWPKGDIPYGERTHIKDPLPKHGYSKWSQLFGSRQLLVLSQLLRAAVTHGDKENSALQNFVLGAFQQYVRNQNMFCFWDMGYDKLVPHMSNNNYNPKLRPVENSVFSKIGRGNWATQEKLLLKVIDWKSNPWELVSNDWISQHAKHLNNELKSKSSKVSQGDHINASYS